MPRIAPDRGRRSEGETRHPVAAEWRGAIRRCERGRSPPFGGAKVPNPAIRVNGPNTLKATAQGDQVQLFINGSQVGSFTYPLNKEGFVGIYVSAGNKVEVRGFLLRQ